MKSLPKAIVALVRCRRIAKKRRQLLLRHDDVVRDHVRAVRYQTLCPAVDVFIFSVLCIGIIVLCVGIIVLGISFIVLIVAVFAIACGLVVYAGSCAIVVAASMDRGHHPLGVTLGVFVHIYVAKLGDVSRMNVTDSCSTGLTRRSSLTDRLHVLDRALVRWRRIKQRKTAPRFLRLRFRAAARPVRVRDRVRDQNL